MYCNSPCPQKMFYLCSFINWKSYVLCILHIFSTFTSIRQ
uniref:Uncharacterized protein n=1 Tax=Anguilla anguilla TaxID=7936 RepID=A0A0E9TLH2_ANGAN